MPWRSSDANLVGFKRASLVYASFIIHDFDTMTKDKSQVLASQVARITFDLSRKIWHV
jgi:hypothetical protein